MIYITGDTHGNYEDLELRVRERQETLNKEDVFIICGDFGFLWWDQYNATKVFGEDNADFYLKRQENILDKIENLPCTIVFVDGNHSNHTLLNTYPLVQWNGGLAHMIRPHIYHLCRGQIFAIEGLKFFCFGGARSHDIQDGLIDAEDPRWKKIEMDMIAENKIYFRTRNIDWWAAEMPSKHEMNHGYARLVAADFKVDYIISHDCPGCIKNKVCCGKSDELNEFFNNIYFKCFDNIDMWFFGHYHQNKYFGRKSLKTMCLFDQVERII